MGKDNSQPPGRPPGRTCDDSDNDYDEYVPFDSHRYPDGQHGAMYMRPTSSPPRHRTHDWKHQKKKKKKKNN